MRLRFPSSHLPRLSVLVGAALALGGCFFTEEINEAPIPRIAPRTTGLFFVGQRAAFDATKSSDDDIYSVRASWLAFRCAPQCNELVGELRNASLAEEFAFDLETHDEHLVQLRVVDRFGAVREQPDVFTVNVGNRDPRFAIASDGYRESDGSFVVSRDVELTLGLEEGTTSFDQDGDEVSFEWELSPPPGSDAGVRRFEAVGATGYRLVPDVEGEYKVTVTASDGFEGSTSQSVLITVGDDSPPCLALLDPKASDVGSYLVDQGRFFSVLSVEDALDPFPQPVDAPEGVGEASFRWFLKGPDDASFAEVPGFTESRYFFDPDVVEPGDSWELRVEVSDRVVGPERELPCADEVGSCALDTGSGCFQRLTWSIDVP